jgi:tetratricopeptide (TPR) repeat protein
MPADDDTQDLDSGHAVWHRRSLEFAEEILALPDERAQAARVRELAFIEPWSVTKALLSLALSYTRSDTHRATTLAAYAVLAAEQMDQELHPADLRAALLASAYCYLGKAFRVAGRSEGAEAAFRHANSYLTTSASDAFDVRVLHLSLLADLRDDQGRLEEAQELRRLADLLEENPPLCDPLPLSLPLPGGPGRRGAARRGRLRRRKGTASR